MHSITENPFSDWIVGDNFLRSVYSMYDLGDYDSNGIMGDPYMKLLSIIDPDQASIEFHQLRGGTPKTNITFTGLDGASVAPSFAISNDITGSLELIGRFIPAMLGIVALNALVVIICCIVWLVSFCRRRRLKRATGRTPRRRLSPMPMNSRNSYIAGVDPSAINVHPYEPVSMALTDDTFVPPSPAFHRFNKKGDSFGGRPYSLSNMKALEPVSPGPDDSFSPTHTENRMSTADNNATFAVEDRGSLRSYRGDASDLKNERVSLRDERVSLRDERLSPRPSMDHLVSEALPAGETSFVRSSMHSHVYERRSTPADDNIRSPSTPIPFIQEPIPALAEAAPVPPVGLEVPQFIPSQRNGGNLSPTKQAFYHPNTGPGYIVGPPSAPTMFYAQDALPPPNPGYLLPHQRSSQVYEPGRAADMGDRPRSIA